MPERSESVVPRCSGAAVWCRRGVDMPTDPVVPRGWQFRFLGRWRRWTSEGGLRGSRGLAGQASPRLATVEARTSSSQRKAKKDRSGRDWLRKAVPRRARLEDGKAETDEMTLTLRGLLAFHIYQTPSRNEQRFGRPRSAGCSPLAPNGTQSFMMTVNGIGTAIFDGPMAASWARRYGSVSQGRARMYICFVY